MRILLCLTIVSCLCVMFSACKKDGKKKPNETGTGTTTDTGTGTGTDTSIDTGTGTSTGTDTGTGSSELPDKVVNPTPTDGATNVPIDQILAWDATNKAESYDVYMGTASPPPLVLTEIIDITFNAGILEYDSTYYWRINSRNAEGITIGDVWFFQTEEQSWPEYVVNSIGMEFRLIPAGSYVMGSPDSDPDALNEEKPQHTVNITHDFYIGVYQVTQAQWITVMGSNPSNFNGDNNPVDSVSWEDAQDFITALNAMEPSVTYRLPAEAEWEYACRAGTTSRYYYGDNVDDLDLYAWYSSNSGSTTHPVGEKLPNAWGLYDMHGNVWEWCLDYYDSTYYQYCVDNSITDDPPGPASGSHRVARGGAWNYSYVFCRSTHRGYSYPNTHYSHYGLRIIREVN